MFQQTLNDIPERKTISFKTTNSNSIIKIEKSKLLPANFFKPLTIQVERKPSIDPLQKIISTPCFGMQEQKEICCLEIERPSQPKQKNDKEIFYSWFSKGMKALSSRVQTVPVQSDSSVQKKRRLTQRKGRLQRVQSVQEQGSKSAFKILKKYQNLIGDKIQSFKPESHYKFKLKSSNLEGIQKSYKNHFKVNGMKRGYADTKYKQIKALNSITTDKPGITFLPLITNG